MDPVVPTTGGLVRGVEDASVLVFRGVPYARAGAGAERWRPPEPPTGWGSVRDAVDWGPVCPQAAAVPGTAFPDDPTHWDEDCLTLNVWTPAADDGRRPVLVWIHGGAFTGGTGASLLYRGDRLAARGDVVVVTINYRLGAFGWLAHPALAEEHGPSGNWGLQDQLAALEWVRQCIGGFGGDPGNVTLFGESAGAMCIAALLSTPAAGVLFHRAILQSGPPATGSARWAAGQAERLAASLECPVGRPSLSGLPAEILVEGGRGLGPGSGQARALPLPFLPVVGAGVLDPTPGEAVARGTAATVPLLVGTNRDEAAFFLLGDHAGAALDVEGVIGRAAHLVGPEAAPVLVHRYEQARRARGEPVSGRDLWCALVTDIVFRLPSGALAEAQATQQADTFSYLFDWESPFLGGTLGSCHALEIPFVFGTFAEPSVAQFSGGGAPAAALSDRMQQAWLAFARSGDPSCEAVGAWPRYEPDRRATMILGARCEPRDDPRGEERAVWEEAGVHPGAGLSND